MISIAVIGAGHLGSIHAKLWTEQSDVRLVAIVDPDRSRGTTVAELYGAAWYANVDEMPVVDAVVIASPTVLHYQHAVTCLQRGIHTFIEKPVTATHAEAELLMDVAKTSGRVIQVGHVERFNPALHSLTGLTLNPLFIEAHRLATFKPRAIDVSVVYDLMIHDIDLLLWLTKASVTNVAATGVAVLTDTPDIANARLTFSNGCIANITASRISAKPLRKMRIFQKERYLGVDLAAGTVEMFRLIDQSELDTSHQIPISNVTTKYGDKTIVLDSPVITPHNAIAMEQRSFVDSIMSGTDAAVTLADGSEAVRIAEQIEAAMNVSAP